MPKLTINPSYYWLKGGLWAKRRLVLVKGPDVLWQPFGTIPDVYDPDYPRLIKEVASRLVKPKDPLLISYLTLTLTQSLGSTLTRPLMNQVS